MFLNPLTAVIHTMCDGRFKAVSKTHSLLEEERERGEEATYEHERDSMTDRVLERISSERETDEQEYRHSNKEGKWKREIERDDGLAADSFVYMRLHAVRVYND